MQSEDYRLVSNQLTELFRSKGVTAAQVWEQ